MGENPSDPVQLYLTQMSSSPLLSRQEELEAARRIEHTRKNLRHAMLGSDYVLQAAVGMLEKAACGRMRIEMVCEGSLTTDQQRQRLMALVGPNLQTLGNLLRRNRLDFAAAISMRRPPEHRRRVRHRLLMRRAKAIRLIEESPVRRQHLQLVLERLKEIARHMDAGCGSWPNCRRRRFGPAGRGPQAVASLDADHARDAGTLRRRWRASRNCGRSMTNKTTSRKAT